MKRAPYVYQLGDYKFDFFYLGHGQHFVAVRYDDNNGGPMFRYERGKVFWKDSSLPNKLKEYVNQIVKEDYLDLKRRWFPYLQD